MATTAPRDEPAPRPASRPRRSSSSRRRSPCSPRCWCSSGSPRSSFPPAPTTSTRRPAARSRARYHELPSCANAQGDELCVETAFDQRFKQLWIAPPNGLYGIENDRGFVSADETGLPLRLGDDLPVRARGRRVHHRDDEDGRDPDRDRAARAALPAQRLGADRDPDGRLRARRDDLRDVGGDARLLRPARAADARARLRPDGRRVDHLPRRRHRRALLDGQPVRDRRRLRRRRHQPRRRHRRADRDVGRARPDGDRLRAPLRAPRARGPVAVGRRDLADGRRGRARADRRRARAHRPPEARPRPVRRRVPGDDLRLHPLERPLAGGLGQRLPAADLRRRSTSPRRRRCSS